MTIFDRIMSEAVAGRWQCKDVVRKLSESIPAQRFPERTIFRHLQKRGWKPGGRPAKGSDGAETKAHVSEGACRVTGTGSESAEVELYSERIITLDDALRKGGVDRDKWDVDRFVVNSWEVGAKGPDGRVRVTPLWQVKAWLKAKRGWDPSEFRRILVDDIKALAPVYKVPPLPLFPTPILAELSIFDAHFGKLAWSPETGQNYDLDICSERYLSAGRDLLARSKVFHPERVLMVVGNDFFHVDHKSMTTAGTPQDCDGRWQKAFRVGARCCIVLAEEASLMAPVDILCVQGNHDREKLFCLGEVLKARFTNSKTIKVINEPDPYQYYRWGKVLLGFVHGENHVAVSKRTELIGQMLSDRPVDCADTVWKEWHLGHLHSESEHVWKYRSVEHIRDFAIRVLPSLSSTDAWHRANGYKSVLSAELHLYHKYTGRAGYLVHCTQG